MLEVRNRLLALLVLAALAAATAAAADGDTTALLRFPDVHGDRVVFTYAGDLWTAPVDGGTALRLTAHPGVELFARYSPDGRWIAFTGQYDGDEQVYVMPAAGGVPQQLTFYPATGPLPPRWGYDNQVYGWTPDGSAVLFRSLRDSWDIGESRLYTIGRDGGLPAPLPMPQAGAGDLSPDGRRAVYSPLFRDFRSWKRYQGGWAQDLWIFDLDDGSAQRITDHPRSDRDPMWAGDTIYLTSDRGGNLELYAYDVAAGGEPRKLTDHAPADVRWPAADAAGRVVYELAGELRLYDPAAGSDRPIPIRVPSDGLWDRPGRVSAADEIEGFGLSPDGRRALVVARGDVFSVPADKGFTRNLTASSGAHDKWAAWSPDGEHVVYLSDASGEEELWLVAGDGSGQPERLTTGGDVFRYRPVWSPDGERIAFSDKNGKLWVLTLAGRGVAEVADDEYGQVNDYAWSPDGAHLAFSLGDDNGFRSLWIWSREGGELRRVTPPVFNEWSPAWDPAGDYLFFLSDRELAPQLGSFEWNYLVDRESYVYALALRTDVPHPFPPQNDEVGDEDDGDDGAASAAGDDGDAAAGPPAVRIDFDGLAVRLARVPVTADNYGSLSAAGDYLLYLRGGANYYGRPSDVDTALMRFDREEREAEELASGVDDYALSADGETVLIATDDGDHRVLAVDAEAGDEGETLASDGLWVERQPRQEWAQIFDEVWRRFRDFFYVDNMHGYDWQALGERYRPLLADVGHRSDLNYLISEMIAELNISHAYIAGGDWQQPERPRVALPGARFELDAAAGRYRLAEIMSGDNAEDRYRAPLTEIGVDARPGDYLLAIDGREVGAGDNPYRLLRHKADRPVELTLNQRPTTDGARRVVFEPLTSENGLLYLAWVNGNRRRVSELSDGRLGYLHVPDMGADGIREFIKWYYPQIRKQGLVVDVRSNGGGNVSQMLIERLSRKLLAVGFDRNSDHPSTYPNTVFHGPMAALLNETSASDGDIFPAMFRAAGLGPLIGKRSWGGVTGITNHGPLIDGGGVFVPEFGFASPAGEWVIEGHGVDPDIVVDNDPASVLAGRDPQLERAVQEVLDRLAAEPMRLPDRPASPVKTPAPPPNVGR